MNVREGMFFLFGLLMLFLILSIITFIFLNKID